MEPTITITSPVAGTFTQFVDDGNGNQYEVTTTLAPISVASLQALITTAQEQLASNTANDPQNGIIASLQAKLAALQAAIPNPSQAQS